MAENWWLYAFSAGGQDFLHTNVAHPLVWNDATYNPTPVSHTRPVFSSDPTQARITVTLKDNFQAAINYISMPPPFETRLRIYEVREASLTIGTNTYQVDEAEAHWKGRVIRVRWLDRFSKVALQCRTLADSYFNRETNLESSHPLCRFFTGDGRCPVDLENFKETVTVDVISTDTVEPTIEVTGITQPDGWYTGGTIKAPDGDWRTIVEHVGSVLTLSRHFPASTLQAGDSVSIYAGDDLTFETCSVKFGADTNQGEAFGGWKWTPSRDYERFGIRTEQA